MVFGTDLPLLDSFFPTLKILFFFYISI